MNDLKLTIELVPKTAWLTNVRSEVSKSEWDRIRKKCYKAANNRCEVCGDVGTNQGVRHAVECHEVWDYNDVDKKQVLTGLVALCPYCHKTKHAGLASIKGELHIVVQQLKKVNLMNDDEAMGYINESFSVWQERSKYDWTIDIDYLRTY